MASSARVEIDHVLVFVEPGAPEAERLARAGLVESFRRRHLGQGTANVCYLFDNAYLELLWVVDHTEATSPAVARTRIAERAEWRRTGASPFGIALRTEPPDAPLPFETWAYKAPFLPEGAAISVAAASDDPRQPLVFRVPGTAGPREPRQRYGGFAEITGVHLDVYPATSVGGPLDALEASELLTRRADASSSCMVLTLSRTEGRPPRLLALPAFTWSG